MNSEIFPDAPPAAEITLHTLRELGVERWFDVEPKPDDLEGVIRTLNDTVVRGKVDPDFRLLAVTQGTVIARFAARLDPSGRLYFWQPLYSSTLPLHLRPEVNRVFLDWCDRVSATRREVKYLETKPADDLPHVDQWLAALSAKGFSEFACAHVLESSPPAMETPESEIASTLRWVGADSVADEVMGDLIRECDAGTLDRVDAQFSDRPHGHWQEIRQARSIPWISDLSAVAFRQEQPVGVVLVGHEQEDNSGWILYVGTLPRERRRHVATRLLEHGLLSLGRRGVLRVKVLIDDLNLPSIRLHESRGFRMQAGRFMIYRKLGLSAA